VREKKEINVQIGKQIRIARERKNLTQEQFAERISVSPQFVSDMERGVVGVSLTTMKNICVELEVSSDTLLFGSPSPTLNPILEQLSAVDETEVAMLADILRDAIALRKYSQA